MKALSLAVLILSVQLFLSARLGSTPQGGGIVEVGDLVASCLIHCGGGVKVVPSSSGDCSGTCLQVSVSQDPTSDGRADDPCNPGSTCTPCQGGVTLEVTADASCGSPNWSINAPGSQSSGSGTVSSHSAFVLNCGSVPQNASVSASLGGCSMGSTARFRCNCNE